MYHHNVRSKYPSYSVMENDVKIPITNRLLAVCTEKHGTRFSNVKIISEVWPSV